jgi:hypothetical protein
MRCNIEVSLWYSAYAFGHCMREKGHDGPHYHPEMHKPNNEAIAPIPCSCMDCKLKRKNAEQKENSQTQKP